MGARYCNRDYPLEQVHGNQSCQFKKRRLHRSEWYVRTLGVVLLNPKNIKRNADSAWIEAMQEELHQFDRLKVWELVDKPFGKMIIKLKWLWKNKKDEDRLSIHTKHYLLLKVNAQKRVYDFEEINLLTRKGSLIDHPEKVYISEESLVWIKASSQESWVPLTWDSGIQRIMAMKLTAFSDVIMPVAIDTRGKSTYGGITSSSGDKLVSGCQRKKTATAMSSAEQEYVGVIYKLVLK
ncbi:hypothetical protein Tco_1082170 [Tanacetum coccineum]|uniref:Uncharacterized protein n=1 Tax=Tanacetum coccineum TaxID=301880 RepID=A0ABQ5HZQ7_9ASTR